MGRVNNFSVYYIHENKRAGLQIFKKTINRPWPSIRHLRVGRNKQTFGKGPSINYVVSRMGSKIANFTKQKDNY